MSDRRAGLVVASLAVAFAVAPLGAQHASGATDDALREVRRLDSLLAARRQAARSLADSLRRGERWVDVPAGALTVRTRGSLAGAVRAAAESAVASVDGRGGAALQVRLAKHVLVITADTVPGLLGIEWVVRVRVDTGDRAMITSQFRSAGPPSARDLVEPLAGAAERVAAAGADSALSTWLMVGRISLRDSPEARWQSAYTELATSPSHTVRHCRTGDAAACLTSLGLDGRGELGAWYAPDDYRELVAVAAVRRPDSLARAAAERCGRDGDAGACEIAARSIPADRVPLPLSADVRQLFVESVLRAGGSGAYGRLVSARGPVRDRLLAAAGMPLDRVVEQWAARVIASRPEPMHVSPLVFVVTLAWCCAFTAIGIGRRSAS
jgi:hypothetical protein